MEDEQNGQTHKPFGLERLSTLKKSISLTGVKIPMREVTNYQKKLAPYLLNKPYSSNIVQDDSNSLDKRIILLKEGVSNELEGLPQDVKTWIENQKENGLEVINHNLDIDFKSYSLEQLMKMLLPSEVSTSLKIENIRDIKIYDLTDDQLKHKETIGKLILEKSPHTQCVLLKTRYIDEENPLSKYFFEQNYELLSGEPNTEIEISEGPCTYKVDLLKVFYESAFQDERERLLSTKNKDDMICDIFADPFYGIRAAKSNKIRVVSNCNESEDLLKFYQDSITSNNVEALVEVKEQELYPFLLETLTKTFTEDSHKHVNHIHVSKFLEDCSFLQIFVGLFKQINDPYYEKPENLPLLHFYIYVPNTEFTDSMRKVLSTKINNIFNEAFVNKEIKDVLDSDDFQTIFIVHDDITRRKLLHCTVKLSNKLAYCAEPLLEKVVSIPTETMEVEEAKEATPKGKGKASKKASKKESKKAEAKPPAEKKASAPKKKKEIVHQASNDATELEKEAEAANDEGGLRRSSRKKTKSKQFEDYDYPPSANKEASK